MARTGKFPRFKKKGKKQGTESTDAVKLEAVKSEGNKKQAVKVAKAEGKKSEGGLAKAAQIKKGTQVSVQGGTEKSDLGGLIFMCNRSTKDDCFKYRVLGLPDAKKNLVEQVRRNMRLFLYDVDLRVLYGIYKASSRGGFNLVADAFRGSRKTFPWQVRFTVLKDCLPLPEAVFKKAIKDNYEDNKKFKIELSFEQVQKLVKLFRPVPSDAGAVLPPRAIPQFNLVKPIRENYEPKYPVHDIRPPPRANFEPSFADDLQLAREIRLRREMGAPEYLPAPVSHPAYGADPYAELELRKTDPYLLGVKEDLSAYPQLQSLGRLQQVPDLRGDQLDRRAYGLDPLADGSNYGALSSEILRKRALDDAHLEFRRLPYEEASFVPGTSRFAGISPLARHYVGSGR